MIGHRHIDKICIFTALAALVITVLFTQGEALGIKTLHSSPGYEARLFDDSRVHTIDLQLEDWEAFLAAAPSEAYFRCDAVIDGETFSNAGLRAKGNNSRRLVAEYGLERYSLKLEFDHFQEGQTYYGLDKFSLDSSFQDNSYLKNYISYDMMEHMGVPSPLRSYVWVTVNGNPHGLFLAVEEPEEAFARRNFGSGHGQLYKPDYRSLNAENKDVALQYISDDPADYDNIFRNAKFQPDEEDKARLVEALKTLNTDGGDLESAVCVEEALRYFTVQVFVVNLDSYLGRTGHNYFLYEEDGQLQILPWDYNLAFATYSLGMPEPVNDAELYINSPIDTPASREIMNERPLFHSLMQDDRYFAQYHALFDEFIASYFESGLFEEKTARIVKMISPYVKEDPSAFCSYEDFLQGVSTLSTFCALRAESIRGQLDGTLPSTIREQPEFSGAYVDAQDVWLPDMGEIADLTD